MLFFIERSKSEFERDNLRDKISTILIINQRNSLPFHLNNNINWIHKNTIEKTEYNTMLYLLYLNKYFERMANRSEIKCIKPLGNTKNDGDERDLIVAK